MEISTPPPQEFRFDGALAGAYDASSVSMNPFAFTDDVDGNPFVATALTAPPSPNPFEFLPPDTPGASDAEPFDLFQHFTSAPASPARAAAIYAQFASGDDGNGADHGGDDFQPRVSSYSTRTVTSTVPFDWEERPGKPKPEFAAATANRNADDNDFDFGVLLDRSAKTPEPAAADELFEEGRILPLKPPPRLLDSGSVGSSPRSPMSRGSLWSPRRRNMVGPGADFDPFAAAMEKAARAPSPLGAGGKDDAAHTGTATSPKNDQEFVTPAPFVPPAATNGGRKKWRLRDLLLFRKLSAKGRAAGNISKDPVFKYSPVQRLGTPVIKKAAAEPVTTNGDVSSGKGKKKSLIGCVRLNPGLHRLTKGLNGPSSHFGRRTARSAMNG